LFIQQGIGEFGRPRLLWKHKIGGSNPSTLTMMLVVGSSYRLFVEWCYKHELSPNDRNVRFVNQPNQLEGYDRETMVIFLRPWIGTNYGNCLELEQIAFQRFGRDNLDYAYV
jgi:hypothetical protein